jgi:methionyl-tRNA formyltransferase
MTSPLKIIFMGSPDFAVPALQALFDSSHEIVAVYTRAPKPKGRGQQLEKTPIHQLADQYHCPVFIPHSFRKDPAAVVEFINFKADLAIVAAYGLILPEAVLIAPKYGCINIHASLLPRWRGASPIHHAIWKGDSETGITIMKMDVGLDTGDMILKKSIPILPTSTTPLLQDQLAHIGADLTLEALSQLQENGYWQAQKQDEALSCYAPLLKKEDGQIDWRRSSVELDQQIRALTPWPSSIAINKDQRRFKILRARADVSHSGQKRGQMGQVFDTGILCGDQNLLQIDLIQPENGKPISYRDAFHGGFFALGDVLPC